VCIPWALNPLGKVCIASLVHDCSAMQSTRRCLVLSYTAPSSLSGLIAADVVFVQSRVEHHVAPEVAKAGDATMKAMKETEHGWQKDRRACRLTKGADGTWRDP
jgi:hypothetical protein